MTTFSFLALWDGPDPEPEFEFHPARHWRFDYAWPKAKLAVEFDGGPS